MRNNNNNFQTTKIDTGGDQKHKILLEWPKGTTDASSVQSFQVDVCYEI